MLTRKKRVFSAFVLILFCILSFLPTASFATENKDTSDSNQKTGSQLIEVTANYLNGIGGTEIINSETYSDDRSEKEPQKIEDYVYVDYEETVDYIYVPKDIPYIVGYPDDTVRPLRYLTRAEATAIFYRLYDGDYPKKVNTYKEGKTFSDVAKDHWAHDNIVQMYESGIISGNDNKFYPDAPISRAELAALATRFNPDKFPSDVEDASFKDISNGKWYEDVVALAAANEWVSGYPDGTFKPEANVTRTETMAVINRVLQRQITSERLNEVGAPNPYTDIKSSDWYYADAIEATIPHNTEDWHVIDYNDGQYNVIIENFVDRDGNTLAETEVSAGKEIKTPKEIPGFKYLGYVQHTTYIYEPGVADPSIEKTSNGEGENAKLFMPGDLVTYTIKVNNSDEATRKIENAVVTDTIPEWVTFVPGSVTVDGQSTEYDLKTDDQKEDDNKDNKDTVDTISVNLGDVKIGTTKTVQFSVTVDKDAYNKEIKNLATVTGDNIEPEEDEDEGYTTLEGKAYLNVDKTVDKTEAKVGEPLTYTIDVEVDRDSDTRAKNVIITDVIDENLDFNDGVKINNRATNDYTYDKETRTLTVELGDIEIEEVKTVTYNVTVAENAWNQTIENVAVAKADNADPADDNAEVVQVPEGTADLDIKKVPSERNVNVGDDFNYTITVNNNKNAETIAHNVVVHDTLPTQIDFYGQVTLNGSNANYTWDPVTRQLDVNVGALDPGQEAEIVIYGKINNTAYGQEIENIAQVTADNADPKEDEAKVVNVAEGDPDGSFTSKVPSVTVAHPGDVYSYTITVQNSPQATADWEVTLTDELPEQVTFDNYCEVNGKQTNDYSYDAGTNTLTLKPDPIKPGEKLIWKFNVKVNEGTEGTRIDNVAILDDGETEEPIPSTPVDVPETPADPYVTKTHDVDTVGDLEYVRYTVTVSNGAAGGVWKNVILEDVLPAETQLSGVPLINGKGAGEDYVKSGNNISVYLGDLQPSESVEVVYEVQVKKGTQKTIEVEEGTEPTEEQINDNTVWLRNVATATGNNGQAGATDDQVKVPPLIVEIPKDPGDEEGTLPDKPWAEKLSEKSIVDLSKDPYNTYTIKMHNDTDEVWQNVSVTDVLDLNRLHLVSDSVKVNGIQIPWGEYQYNIDEVSLKDTMVIPVGDIQPGSTATVEFEVRFENDGAEDQYVNVATVTSDNQDNITVEAPTVTFNNIGVITGQHVKLFAGYTDGAWWPDVEKNGQDSKYLSQEEACCVVARSITAEQRGKLLGGKSLAEASASLSDVWPQEEWYAGPVRFMGAIKCLQDIDVDYNTKEENKDWYNYNGNTPRMVVTREQLGRMINAVGLDAKLASAEYSDTDPDHMTSRAQFATEICKILNRDQSPDFNNCERPSFTDVSSSLVSEVSIFHSYVLHGHTNDEIWTFSDSSRGVEI